MPRAVLAVILSLAATASADRMPEPAPPPPPPPVPEVRITRTATKSQTSLTTKLVARKISSAYLGSVRRCYERVQRTAPGAAGAATITFTVDPVGKVAGPSTRTFHRALTRCVGALVARWRFPIPQSRYAEPTSAKFVVGLAFAMVEPEPPASP